MVLLVGSMVEGGRLSSEAKNLVVGHKGFWRVVGALAQEGGGVEGEAAEEVRLVARALVEEWMPCQQAQQQHQQQPEAQQETQTLDASVSSSGVCGAVNRSRPASTPTQPSQVEAAAKQHKSTTRPGALVAVATARATGTSSSGPPSKPNPIDSANHCNAAVAGIVENSAASRSQRLAGGGQPSRTSSGGTSAGTNSLLEAIPEVSAPVRQITHMQQQQQQRQQHQRVSASAASAGASTRSCWCALGVHGRQVLQC